MNHTLYTDRATWERTGPGARDGPALLDQVAVVKQSMPDFPIIANGNVITYDDVISNKQSTGADGIMSAEGILDNPALFFPRLGDANTEGKKEYTVPKYAPLSCDDSQTPKVDKSNEKKLRKLQKKLREIQSIEQKVLESGKSSIDDDQQIKLLTKSKIQAKLDALEKIPSSQPAEPKTDGKYETTTLTLSELAATANDKLALAKEYLSLVRLYPTKIRTVVFHTRRMCKSLLEKYQLMEDCISCSTVDEVDTVLAKIERYTKQPHTFHYDQEKAAKEKDALARKKREEGKRKAFEGRMIRKAKREGLDDLEHYLRIGAEVPTVKIIQQLKGLSKEERLAVWKKDHSQHCLSYHLEEGGCKRDRACAFLHTAAKGDHTFVEDDEVAG